MAPPLPSRRLQPGTLVVVSFAVTIGIGTLLLRLPGITTGAPLTWLQALFTATSATCVTGLIVVDTATDLTTFGQGIVLLLIQVGGLGILTFSLFALLLLGQRGSMRMRHLFQDMLHLGAGRTLGSVVARVVALTLALEGIGALVLFGLFRSRGDSVGHAAWFAVFHSVSALCNAGFALYSDSLESLADAPAFLAVISVLVVLGGIGFLVLLELPRWARAPRPRPHLSLHTRVVLLTTLVLIPAGAGLLYALEHREILAAGRPAGAWGAAVFQSISARTAGFNTIPIGDMTTAGLFVMMVLMFIGGSPGSIAGGVKTTTVALFIALCYSWLRGRDQVVIGKRTVPAPVVQRAIAAIGISVFTITVGLFLLLAFEQRAAADPHAVVALRRLAFEAVSAFGTVGLSTGITGGLSPSSHGVLVLLMFAGRVGPLTLTFTLLGDDDAPRVGYPEEPVMIG